MVWYLYLSETPLPHPEKARLYDGIRAPWKIYCIETAYELYKQYGCERYVEMLRIINEAWKGNVDAYLAGVIRGVACFCRIVLGGDFSDIVTRWHLMGR